MGEPVRVLQAIRQGTIGGGESHVQDLVTNLDRTRFEPIVLSFTEGQMVENLRRQGIKTFVIPNLKPFNIFTWGKVRELMKAENIQLVHAHGTRAASNVFRPAQQLNVPLVYTIHGWSFNDSQSNLKRMLSVAAEKFLTSRSNQNISVSASNQETGKRNIPTFHSSVVRNGINLTKFSANRTYKDVRAELGISQQSIVLGFIVRITKQKDPVTLLKAFQEVCHHRKDVVLLMVGEGDLKEEAISLSHSLSINDRVIFQPFRQDIPDILNAVDVYCLPSLWEGLSIGLLEAMAMGKAVVASRVDGTIEVIKDNYNGILVESSNPEQLAKAILLLCDDRRVRERLGAQAKQTVDEEFNALKMTQQIENQYLTLLK
jgi:glycosyltransferase involved in cell wall biosynthesis